MSCGDISGRWPRSTLTIPLDHPWWELGAGAVVVVFGLCAQSVALPVLGFLVLLWPDRGLGARASAHRVLDLVSGLEFRRRWPWTLSGALLAVLGWVGAGFGAMGLVFLFTHLMGIWSRASGAHGAPVPEDA